MSAHCDFSLDFYGTEEDFQSVIKTLYAIEGKDMEEKRIIPIFQRKENWLSADNGSCREIWGDYYLEPTADLYLVLAKAAGKSGFSVDSSRVYEGGGGGCESYMTADYEKGKLIFKSQCHIDTYCIAYLLQDLLYELEDEDEEFEFDECDLEENPELVDKITYEMFCEHFEVDDSITEEVYYDLLQCPFDSDVIVTNDTEVSVDEKWETEVYLIDEDGAIRDEEGNVDENMMKKVQQLEEKIRKYLGGKVYEN